MNNYYFIVSNARHQDNHYCYQCLDISQALNLLLKDLYPSWITKDTYINCLWLRINDSSKTNTPECLFCYYPPLLWNDFHEVIEIDKFHLASTFLKGKPVCQQLSLFEDSYWGL